MLRYFMGMFCLQNKLTTIVASATSFICAANVFDLPQRQMCDIFIKQICILTTINTRYMNNLSVHIINLIHFKTGFA